MGQAAFRPQAPQSKAPADAAPESRRPGGRRRSVGSLALAILHDPDLLIPDAPTSGLDPNQVVEAVALRGRALDPAGRRPAPERSS
jgi:ABC-type transporter Mla maintaining outer membrane lipid asymmetry ATPase subunit MlaF